MWPKTELGILLLLFGCYGSFLLLLRSCYFVWSTVGLIAKRKQQLRDIDLLSTIPEVTGQVEKSTATRHIPNAKAMQAAGKVLGALACCALTFAIGHHEGYRDRDLEAYSSLHTFHNMIMVDQHSDFDFEMAGELDGKPTPAKFCDKLGFPIGTKFRTMTFYVVNGCISFNGPKVELDPEMESVRPVIHQIAINERDKQ